MWTHSSFTWSVSWQFAPLFVRENGTMIGIRETNLKLICTSNREPGVSDPKRGRHFPKGKRTIPTGHYPYQTKALPRNAAGWNHMYNPNSGPPASNWK